MAVAVRALTKLRSTVLLGTGDGSLEHEEAVGRQRSLHRLKALLLEHRRGDVKPAPSTHPVDRRADALAEPEVEAHEGPA
jgi:hypothetical protein